MEVVIGAAGWFAQFAFDKFVDSKLDEWAAQSCLADEVKIMRDYLHTSQAMLDALGDRSIGNDRFPPLLVELKSASYDADDLIDELDYYRLKEMVEGAGGEMRTVQSISFLRLATNRTGKFVSSQFSRAVRFVDRLLLHNTSEPNPEAFPSGKSFDKDAVSARIKTVSDRLKKAMKSVDTVVQLQRFVASTERPTKTVNARETSSLLTEPKVFGRDKERETAVELLLSQYGKETKYKNFSVLPIVGIGGVGKTTLAQAIYNDRRIVNAFEVRAWACASDTLNTLDVRKLTIDITVSIDDEGSFNLAILNNLDKLQTKLQEKLRGKKFLIVLDDVWVSSRWELLIAPLLSGMAGSRIVVTTRDQNIAKKLGTMPDVKLRGLENNFFWDFFIQNAFAGARVEDNPSLVPIGQEIVAKLHGIPLAAKTVGRLLNKKLDEEHWLSIQNSNLWNLRQAPDDIMPVLMLSYQNLSVYVQRCFSYCSVFPKDHLFTKEELIYTWMAHGFIETRMVDQTPELAAQECLNELLSGSFFQPAGGCYLMHDLLHDLAISVCKDECHVMNNDFSTGIPVSTRHLCVPCSIQTREKCRSYSLVGFESQQSPAVHSEQSSHNNPLEMDKLRTLIFTNFSVFGWGTNGFENIYLKCASFTNVRVLTSPYTKKQEQLFGINTLIHLRYLDLSYSSFDQLPESICGLYHLQVLNIHRCQNLLHLPKGIVNLTKLRHLIADAGRHYLGRIPGVGKMTCLQELDAFYVQKESEFKIHELKELNELGGSLRICNLENIENGEDAHEARLKNKKHLSELWLSWDDHSYDAPSSLSLAILEGLSPPPYLKRLDIIGYKGTFYPAWLVDNLSLSCLTSLLLRDWSGWDTLPPLGQLPHLKKLHMISLLSIKRVGRDFYGTGHETSFPRLKELLFATMQEWQEWDGIERKRLFPRLKILTVRDCPKLKKMPVFFPPQENSNNSLFPLLTRLVIQRCPGLTQPPPLPHSSNLTTITLHDIGSISEMKLKNSNLYLHGSPQGFLQFRHLKNITSFTLHICANPMSLRYNGGLGVHENDMYHSLSSLGVLEINNSSITIELLSATLSKCFSLKTLSISSCPNISMLDLSPLKSLEKLSIQDCHLLGSLSGWQIQMNLKQLTVLRSPGFGPAWNKLIEEGKRWHTGSASLLEELYMSCTSFLTSPICKKLTSLNQLTIGDIYNAVGQITALTNEQEKALVHLTSLKTLVFRNCPNLQSLPVYLYKMSNLKELHVIMCHGVSSLPDKGLPSSLELLVIDRNSELDNKCQGTERYKIAHVKDLKYS
ncbi:hypothetical protein LUZ60_017313 [Juncus effusus]|nr:hypothetical protein LUZ60_017313 [Juncus effusus]